MDYKIETGYGVIEFGCNQMVGCCGISEISNVQFRKVTDKFKMYDFFYNNVLFGKDDIMSPVEEESYSWGVEDLLVGDDHWRINKFIFSDRVGRAMDKASVFEFMKYIGAPYGTTVFNPNSGNDVILFEVDRPKDKHYSQNLYE